MPRVPTSVGKNANSRTSLPACPTTDGARLRACAPGRWAPPFAGKKCKTHLKAQWATQRVAPTKWEFGQPQRLALRDTEVSLSLGAGQG